MGERKKEKLNLKRFILKLLSLLGYDCSRVDIAPLGKGKKGSQKLSIALAVIYAAVSWVTLSRGQYISRVNSYNPKWNNCNTSINCFIPKKRSVKDSLEFYSVKYCIASTRLLSILTSRCRWLPVTRPVCPT